jgi:transaldolase
MQIFIDTGNVKEMEEANSWGIIDGVTTNPTLVMKAGKDRDEIIHQAIKIVNGPISAEVISTTTQEMITEGEKLAQIHANVTIKLPMTIDGIKATKYFSKKGIKTNVTLVFSAVQAILAAKAGATFVSPFIGRLDDININGLDLIEDIRTIYDNYGFTTKILVASIRAINHVKDAAICGADVATIPFNILKALFGHPLTTGGLATFLADAKK